MEIGQVRVHGAREDLTCEVYNVQSSFRQGGNPEGGRCWSDWLAGRLAGEFWHTWGPGIRPYPDTPRYVRRAQGQSFGHGFRVLEMGSACVVRQCAGKPPVLLDVGVCDGLSCCDMSPWQRLVLNGLSLLERHW